MLIIPYWHKTFPRNKNTNYTMACGHADCIQLSIRLLPYKNVKSRVFLRLYCPGLISPQDSVDRRVWILEWWGISFYSLCFILNPYPEILMLLALLMASFCTLQSLRELWSSLIVPLPPVPSYLSSSWTQSWIYSELLDFFLCCLIKLDLSAIGVLKSSRLWDLWLVY